MYSTRGATLIHIYKSTCTGPWIFSTHTFYRDRTKGIPGTTSTSWYVLLAAKNCLNLKCENTQLSFSLTIFLSKTSSIINCLYVMLKIVNIVMYNFFLMSSKKGRYNSRILLSLFYRILMPLRFDSATHVFWKMFFIFCITVSPGRYLTMNNNMYDSKKEQKIMQEKIIQFLVLNANHFSTWNCFT